MKISVFPSLMDIITNTQSDNNASSLKSTFQLLSTFHFISKHNKPRKEAINMKSERNCSQDLSPSSLDVR